MPQPHPTETETAVGSDGSGCQAQYQIRGVPPNAVDPRVFLAFGTVQTEETFINSKGLIIALTKSKSLQLQSNKLINFANRTKLLLFNVLYLFHGNASAAVPLVAGRRGNDSNVPSDFGAKKKKKIELQTRFFCPSLNFIKVNLTVIPKSLALFWSEASDVSCLRHLLECGGGPLGGEGC